MGFLPVVIGGIHRLPAAQPLSYRLLRLEDESLLLFQWEDLWALCTT